MTDLNSNPGSFNGSSLPYFISPPRSFSVAADIVESRLLLPYNASGFDTFSLLAGSVEPLELIGGNSGPLSMNDSSVFSSDDFRMYVFKIRRCTRGRSHDWTDCPFAHPGEKARRRDPRNYNYSGTPCVQFSRGTCKNGDACEFAHGVFECWLHPTRYRTQPCKDGVNCSRRNCFFAHTKEQLRLLPSAMVAAVKNLQEEADETTRFTIASQSISVSSQPEVKNSGRLQRASIGSLSHVVPSLSPSCIQQQNGLYIPHSNRASLDLEPTSLPTVYPREVPAEFPVGSSVYTLSHAYQNTFRESLPLKQAHRMSFALSEESFADNSSFSLADYSSYCSSLPGSSSPCQHSQYGMDGLVQNLQALDLQPRLSMPLEGRCMASNPLNQHLQNLHLEAGSGSRRSFEVPRRWKAMEDERLRMMAIMGKMESGQFLAQQDPFSDGASQQWSLGTSEMDDAFFTELGQQSFMPGVMSLSDMALSMESGVSVMRDPWGNPVSRNSAYQ